MGTHPIFESDFDCLTEKNEHELGNDVCVLIKLKRYIRRSLVRHLSRRGY